MCVPLEMWFYSSWRYEPIVFKRCPALGKLVRCPSCKGSSRLERNRARKCYYLCLREQYVLTWMYEWLWDRNAHERKPSLLCGSLRSRQKQNISVCAGVGGAEGSDYSGVARRPSSGKLLWQNSGKLALNGRTWMAKLLQLRISGHVVWFQYHCLYA